MLSLQPFGHFGSSQPTVDLQKKITTLQTWIGVGQVFVSFRPLMLQHQAQAPQWRATMLPLLLTEMQVVKTATPKPCKYFGMVTLAFKHSIECKCTDCWTSYGRYICATVLHYNLQESAHVIKVAWTKLTNEVPFLGCQEGGPELRNQRRLRCKWHSRSR